MKNKKEIEKVNQQVSQPCAKPNVSDCFLFDIGDNVIYEGRGMPSLCKIIKRKRKKDHFLSNVYSKPIYFNVYITEEKYEIHDNAKSFFWEDREERLRSADIVKPIGAVDYKSDEFTADFIDKKGNILKTIKSGKSGYAHEIVSSLFK